MKLALAVFFIFTLAGCAAGPGSTQNCFLSPGQQGCFTP